MVLVYITVSLAILAMTAFSGIITNLFIVVVNIMEWAENGSLNSCDQILLAQGVFSICLQCTGTTNDVLLFLFTEVYYSDEVYPIIYILLLFTIYASFWFTVCHCGFYCINIVSSHHSLLILLKIKLPKLVPWLLLWSVMLALVTSVPAAMNFYKETPDNGMGNISSNVRGLPKLSNYYLLFSSILCCCLPLLLVGMCNLLIIQTLCAHSRRMEQNLPGMSSSRLGASIGAAKIVTSLLVLYIAFYTSQILLILKSFPPVSPWFCICLFVIYAYSPIQSIILICGSPKLKRWTLRVITGWRSQHGVHPGQHLVSSIRHRIK